MLSSRSRSGSFETGHRGSSSAPKSTKATLASSHSSDSRSVKGLERKNSTKSTSSSSSSSEKRSTKISEMQQHLNQLEQELKKEKEEKNRALDELAEMKARANSERNDRDDSSERRSRVGALEREVQKAKESERKMLESLVLQTKQLGQTKISLEEAKLEIKSLRESSRSLESSIVPSSSFGAAEEIRVLRNELKLAMEAEERCKKAMDDLAIVLTEVTTEAKQVKGRLSATETELENTRAEAEHSKASLAAMEEKLRLVSEECESLKFELEESVAAWSKKEEVLVNCMKNTEEEINKTKQENIKLVESQRVVREENARLREIVKQAVSEANVAKETLEIAKTENSQLKNQLSEKEQALQRIKQELECLKVSEAAAQDSLTELKSMFAAPQAASSSKTDQKSNGTANADVGCGTIRSSSEMSITANGRRHSIGEPEKFKGCVLDPGGASHRQKDRMFASLSNVADMKAASSVITDDWDYGFEHIDATQLEQSVKQKKKKPVFQKFSGIFRRKSVHKSNLESLAS